MNPQQASERWSHSWRRSLFILRFQLIQWEDFRFIELLIKYFLVSDCWSNMSTLTRLPCGNLWWGIFIFFFEPLFNLTWFKIENCRASAEQLHTQTIHCRQFCLKTLKLSQYQYWCIWSKPFVIFCCTIVAFMCFWGDFKISRHVLCFGV